MPKQISARDARAHFAELTDRVHYTGEPVVVEKQGRPFVAVVSMEDLDALERLRGAKAEEQFARLAASGSPDASPPSDDEIVEAVKRTREALHRERYGAA